MTTSEALPPMQQRYRYSAIVDRAPLRWPNGARVAVWVVPNVEHFRFDLPAVALCPLDVSPDVLNYSWRDYGARVGVWRLMDVMDRHDIRGTVALNSDVCELYPRIIEAGQARGWEWMGHAPNNSMLINRQSEADERGLIAETLDVIAQRVGARPRGWLSPALTESSRTLDLLAELGVDYVADWVNDEQPYPMAVRSGRMTSIPYSIEVNDAPFFLIQKQSAEAFGTMIKDQFDQLYEDGAASARVMAIALHPYIIGQPFRSRYLADALAHIAARQDVWFATGSEIVDAYRAATAGLPADRA